MNDLLSRAIRNSVILSWWHGLDSLVRESVVCTYAAALRCPRDEIDSDFTQPEDLDWLWEHYEGAIRAAWKTKHGKAFA